METEIIVENFPGKVKDKAKKYGAIFDAESRRWYITPDCKYKRLFEPVELYVEFVRKDEAKEDGAFFDKLTKKWFALRLQKELIQKYPLELSEDEDDASYVFTPSPK